MPDIIHLLPDSVANQIAAGEVIQRPASAVKELLENAVDSGADEIKLIIKDSGKTLIQVVDNGCGMSDTDSRMAFERHATSKIREANDLFAIQTLGFRGEALASIAAIAQVEMKSKRVEDETGSKIQIEGSRVMKQEACASANGTSMLIKNLFYNIPARRKFLKSNSTELRHIIEEFHRVALVRPEISFTFINDNRQLFVLNSGNLKQRIVALFGNSFNNKLIPLGQESDVINISGFIGKPEFARKTRGEQFFFVNGRYIRHPYLNHAVDNTFKELIPKDAFPTYFIYFHVDPKEIDINIHPTKTEINFQNNQVIYAMLNSTIKQALGKFNITPSLDFQSEPSINFGMIPENAQIRPPEVKINTSYNPFEAGKTPGRENISFIRNKPSANNWEKLYPVSVPEVQFMPDTKQARLMVDESQENLTDKPAFQLHENFIITSVRSGLMLIHRQRAMERILFEEYLARLEQGKGISQQTLFPLTLNFPADDMEILNAIQPELNSLGFDMEPFGPGSFIILGYPPQMNNPDVKDVLDNIIENIKKNLNTEKINKNLYLAQTMAAHMAFRHKGQLQKEEIKSLIDRLFATDAPEVSPDGKPVVRIITLDELNQKF